MSDCENCAQSWPAHDFPCSSADVTSIDSRLLWLLRRAGEEWGALGVALAAARLTDPAVVVRRLTPEQEEQVWVADCGCWIRVTAIPLTDHTAATEED